MGMLAELNPHLTYSELIKQELAKADLHPLVSSEERHE